MNLGKQALMIYDKLVKNNYATIQDGDTPKIIPMQKDNMFRQKCPFK